MNTRNNDHPLALNDQGAMGGRTVYFSRLYKKPVHVSGEGRRLGKVSDIVFALEEPAPRAVGVYIYHGWGKPDEFIPWDRVVDLFRAGILVKPPESGEHYSPFQDQPGWLLVDKHLMGRTVLDIDDRKIETVNDVVLQQEAGTWRLVAVDTSFNGFLRKWRMPILETLIQDDLIPWKYVQPLSIEDATQTETLQLSVARAQLQDLPKEDLADVLEELSGEEQTALFSALEPEKAAETLTEAEPRAQRQIMANLRQERAQTILASLSTPQLVDLLTVLPHDDQVELLALLPEPRQGRVRALLSEREVKAPDFMDQEFLTITPEATVADAKALIRTSGLDYHGISYLYVQAAQGPVLGVVDSRQVLLEVNNATMESLMVSPVVTAEVDAMREDLAALFHKYHFRTIPVVDASDRVLGVVRHGDMLKIAAKP
jgi:sporulation protein YlmC with PRC-barrel domain/CBS domain-containing protein